MTLIDLYQHGKQMHMFAESSSSTSGLKLDYSTTDMKRGKLVHVPDAIYKKGCVQNVQQGMQVHKVLQRTCYFTSDAIFSINCVISYFYHCDTAVSGC